MANTFKVTLAGEKKAKEQKVAPMSYRPARVDDKIMVRVDLEETGKTDTKTGWFPAEVIDAVDRREDVNQKEKDMILIYPTRIRGMKHFTPTKQHATLTKDTYGQRGQKEWYHISNDYFQEKVWVKSDATDVAPSKSNNKRKAKESDDEDSDDEGMPPTDKKGEPAPESAQIKQMKEELEKMQRELRLVKEGVEDYDDKNAPLPESYLGVMGSHHERNFLANVDKTEKPYYWGKHQLTGIGNPENDGRQMCSKYKDITTPCVSKTLVAFEMEDGTSKKKFVSKPAEFVHMGLLGLAAVRDKPAQQLSTYLRHCAVCGKCKDAYGPTNQHMMNIAKKAQCCSICKVGYKLASKSTALDMGHLFGFCVGCRSATTSTGNMYSDELIKYAMLPIGQVFDKKLRDFRVVTNKAVTNVSGRTHTPDVLMEFECYGLTCIVLIENDPDSHSKYKDEDENLKMSSQAATMLRRFVKDKGVDAEKFRMLLIRFSSSGNYERQEDGKSEIYEYNSIERLIILRRWIIWWITHIKEVRNVSMFYMFYKKEAMKNLLWRESECFAKLYHAPKAETPERQDWTYCPDFTEIAAPRVKGSKKTAYDNINQGQLLPAEQLGSYVMLKKVQRYVLPPGLMDKVLNPLPPVTKPKALEESDDDDHPVIFKRKKTVAKKKVAGDGASTSTGKTNSEEKEINDEDESADNESNDD